MAYLDELFKEFDSLRDSVPHSLSLIKRSKSARLAKLRRYIARMRGEHVPKQKWLTKLFHGRSNRTPWKLKNQKYVEKRLRS